MRAERGRRKANEQDAKEKVEMLLRELAVATQPTIQHIVKAYDEAPVTAGIHVDASLFDLYELIMSLTDEKLREETEFRMYGRSLLLLAARFGFPHAALSRLVQCGSVINTKDYIRQNSAGTRCFQQLSSSLRFFSFVGCRSFSAV
jgi:hypothetical protein